MTINNIEQKDIISRFFIGSRYAPSRPHTKSDSAKRAKMAHDRVELIKEAKELGCDIEDLI